MKTNSTHQEILLLTGTTFSKTQCVEKDTSAETKNLTQYEQLENACWNGLLDEMLPGIVDITPEGKKLYLWQVRHCALFLEMELCESPREIERASSIDPYSFLSVACYN